MFNKKKSVMKAKVKAVWNDKTKKWEYSVSSNNKQCNLLGNYIANARKSTGCVDACDDLVLGLAILEHNGLDINAIMEKIKRVER